MFSFSLFALPNEPVRRLQVWLASLKTSVVALCELGNSEPEFPRLMKDVFPKHRFAGESKWLLAKL
ncbi:MAG TPA: hypothetical protein DCO65_04395 [Spartobacteria bacterium]|nr:hypothetical protein [Spartobacteria bacterium]